MDNSSEPRIPDAAREAPHPRTHRRPPRRLLPVSGAFRPGPPSDIWYKPATNVTVVNAIVLLTLLGLGRLDLAMYTTAGTLCALFCHHLPYAARARVLPLVVAGMLAGVGIALTAAALHAPVAALIAVGALLAAGQKLLADAFRLGPPGHLILTFVSASCLFVPDEQLSAIPAHLGLGLAAGAVSWLASMAPALVRPSGPQRLALARALTAAAALVDAPGTGRRRAAAAALHGARDSLSRSGRRDREALAALLLEAGDAAARPGSVAPDELRAAARSLRRGGPVPLPAGGPRAVPADLLEAARHRIPWRVLLPHALRTLAGCALAGYAAQAIGIGRPYWAIVTAAALYQANTSLTWKRALNRSVGAVAGLAVFAALLPVTQLGPTAKVVCCLVFFFGAEALMTRAYWLGQICVTSMALLMTEFAVPQDARLLISDRFLDTVAGAVLGMLAAFLITNRAAATRVEHALARVESVLAAPVRRPHDRHRIAAAVVELRDAADAAAGERLRRGVPSGRVDEAERDAHRRLAGTVPNWEREPA